MTIFKHALALASVAALMPTLALAQTDAQDPSDWEEEYPAPEDDRGAPPPASAQAPAETPPPPASDDGSAGVPDGQWVRTSQYGWVWMPYADAYTRVPPNGYGEPYMYVWGPSLGWCWVAAPWVWGFGPWPYFGGYAPIHFGWYAHGWWRTPSRWHWAHQPYGGYRGGWDHGWGHGGYRGVAPAPPRGVRPAPGFRGGERPYSGGHFGARPFSGSNFGPRAAPGGGFGSRGFSSGPAFGGRGGFSGGAGVGAHGFSGGRHR